MDLHGLRILKFVESIFTPSKDSSKKHCNEQKQATDKLKNGVLGSNKVENQNQFNIKMSRRSATNLNITEKNGKASIQSDPEKKNCLSEILNNFGLRRRRRRCNVREIRNKKDCFKHISPSPQKFSKERNSTSDTDLAIGANHVKGDRKIDVTAPDQASSSFKNNFFNLYSCKAEYENPFYRKLSKAFSRNKNGSRCYKCPMDKSSSKLKCAYENDLGHFNVLNFPNSNSIINSSNTVKPSSKHSVRFRKDTETFDEISVSAKSVSDQITLPMDRKMRKSKTACALVKALPHNKRKPKEHNCEMLSKHPKSQMGMIDLKARVCENSKFNCTSKKRGKKPFFAYFATKVFKNSGYDAKKKERGRPKKAVKRECLRKTTKLPESHPSPHRNNLDQTSKQLDSSLTPHCNSKSTPSVDYSIWKPSKKCERKNFRYDLPAKHTIEMVPKDVIKKVKYSTTHRHPRPRSGNLKRFSKSPIERYLMNQYECYCAMFNKRHSENHNGDGNFCCPYEDCPKRELQSNQMGDSPSMTSAAIDSVADFKTGKKRGQGMCKSLECRYITNRGNKPRQPCTCIAKMMKEHQSSAQARRQSKQGSIGKSVKSLKENHGDNAGEPCTCISKMMKGHKSPPEARRQSKQGSTGKSVKSFKENHGDNAGEPCTCIRKMMKGHQSPPEARRQSKQGSFGKGAKPLRETAKSSPEMVVIHSRYEKNKNKKLNASGTEMSVKGMQCCPPKPILHNHKCQCKADHICFCFGEGDEDDDDEGVGGGGGGRCDRRGGGGGEGGGGSGGAGGRRDSGGGRRGVRGGRGDTGTGKKGGAASAKKGLTASGKKGAAAPGKKGVKPAVKKGAKPPVKKGTKPAGKTKATATRKKGAKGPARKGARATGKKRGKGKVIKRKEYFGKKGAKTRAKELNKYKKGFGKFVKGAKKLHASKACKFVRVFEGKVRSRFCPRKTYAEKAGKKCCKCVKYVGRLFCQRVVDYYEYRKASKKRKTFFKRLYHFVCFPLRKTKFAILAIFDLFNERNCYITKVDCDTIYIHALRDRPCFWVYRKWPKLYPYFLYYRKSFLRCMNILMIIMAAFMWIPIVMSCYLFISLLRACLCN